MTPGRDQQFLEEARRRERQAADLRERIERCASTPDEIHSIINSATGVAPGDGDSSVLQVVKGDGVQLHVALQAGARRQLIRALQDEEERVREEASNGGPAMLG